MANWKEVALTDNVPNLGNTNLTCEANRSFTLKQVSGSTLSKMLTIEGESTDGSSATALKIMTSSFNADGTTTPTFTHEYSGVNMLWSSSLIMQFNSTSVWACTAPLPIFTCDQMTVTNHGAGSAANPTLALRRQPPLGDDYGEAEDNLGVIKFEGEDSGGVNTTYASIESSIVDATNATEDGRLDIRLMNAGTVASALKILPKVANDVTGKLDSLEVYEATLKDLLIGFQKYSLSRYFKMYITPESTNGFEHLHSYPFKHALDMKQAGGNQQNAAYEIGAGAYSNFADGSVPLDGAYGDSFLSTGLSDDVGYGDSWVPYNHPSDAPAVTVKISGHIWWKPKYDPPTGQSISTWLGHEVVADGHITDISEDSGLKFNFVDETETYELSDGEEVTKVPFSFTYDIGEAPGVASNHLFLLGMRVKDGQASGYLGQQAGVVQEGNYAGMAVDIAMLVYPQ